MLQKATLLCLSLGLTGCGTGWKTTEPERTALDQILLSTAAERAAKRITTDHQGRVIANLDQLLQKTFIDTKNFKSYDREYALHAIQRHFLDAGVSLVDTAKEADTIVEVASGALSVDNAKTLVGLPSMALPIPFAGTMEIPEIALYKEETNRSLAKFAVSFRDARTGRVKNKSFFTMGTAQVKTWTILLLFDIVENDLELPEQYESVGDD